MANEWYKDYNAVQRRAPAGSGGAAWAAYLKQKTAVEKGYSEAFKELDIAAQQEGVTAERPILSSGMSQAQHQEVLQEYLKNINSEVLRKNVTAALKDIQSQGMQSGVNVGLPSLANLTQENAQSVINSYVNTVNQKVYHNYATTAVNDLHSQGVANGVNVAVPVISNNISQTQAQDIVNKYQSQVNSALLTKSTQDTINGVAAQAKQYGVSVSTPRLNNLTEASANKIVDDYVKQVNNAILVKSTQDAINGVAAQAESHGVKVATPTVSANITESAANALIDKYVADVNSKLSTVAAKEAQAQAVSDSQIQTSQKVNNALVGPSETVKSVAVQSISKNSDGSLAVNEGLYNQLKAAQTQHKSWWNDYSGIPQQVIDSQATDVRINSKGQFEWTPVTAADKAQLDKINVQRTRSGLAPRTTLIHGPEKSNEYNTKWLSTTGSGSRGVGEAGVKIKDASGKTVKSYDYNTANLAKVGSGDIKIAAIKAGSSINASATAKTNTAQDVKATKITQKEIKAKEIAAHPGQVQLKDGTWINQTQGSQGIKESVKIISAVKSLEEADKLYHQKLAGNYNPVSRKDITTGDKKTVIHGTVTNEIAKAKHDKAVTSANEFKKQLEAFNDTIAGLNAKSIQTQGHRGTGEGNVFVGVAAKDASGKTIKAKDGQVQYTARSKSGSTYAAIQTAEERAARQSKKDRLAGNAYFFDVTPAQTSKIVSGDLQGFKTLDKTNLDAKVAKALAEAHKVNPEGSEEYFAGVAESARRSSIGTKAVITEDLAAWNALVSKATKPAVNKLYDAIETRDKLLKSTSISFNEKGKISITKAGKETLDNSVTYNANKVHKDIINDSVFIQGFNRFAEAELKEIANKPVTYAGKLGVTYAAGAGLGVAAGTAKVLTKMGGAKLAESVGTPILKKGIKVTSAVAVDAALVGSLGLGVLAEDAAFKANTVGLSGQALRDAKVNRAASYFEVGKEFAAGGLGFAKGMKAGGKLTTDIITSPKTARSVKKLGSGDYSKLPSEYDITRVGKPIIPKTTAQKIAKLETRISKLETSGKASNLAKAKELKRIVRAYKTSSKNEAVRQSLGKDTYTVRKELAETTAFDKELAQLKEIQSFANDWMKPGKFAGHKTSQVKADAALERMTKLEKLEADAIKEGTTLAEKKAVRLEKLKELHTKRNAEIKSAKATNAVKTTANKFIDRVKPKTKLEKASSFDELEFKKGLNSELKRYNSKVEKKSLTDEAFDAEVERLKVEDYNKKLDQLKADKAFDNELAYLREIKKFADTYMQEGKYKSTSFDPIMGEKPAENALLRLTPGEKAELFAMNKGTTAKALKEMRLEAGKAAHEKANKRIQAENTRKAVKAKVDSTIKEVKGTARSIPKTAKRVSENIKSDIKNMMVESEKTSRHNADKRVLRNARKAQQYTSKPKDITDIPGYQRSKAAKKALTYKDIADYKTKNPTGRLGKSKPASAKIDEYTFLKNAEEFVKASNKLKAQNKAKSASDKEFDLELENLKEKDFDKRLEGLRLKQKTKALMTEDEAAIAVQKALKQFGNSKKSKSIESTKTTESAKVEDKFSAAQKKFRQPQKSNDTSGTVARESGNLQLLQKTEQVTKDLEIVKKVETQVKREAKRPRTKVEEEFLEKRQKEIKAKRELEVKRAEEEKAKKLKAEVKPIRKAGFTTPYVYSRSQDEEVQYLRHPSGKLDLKVNPSISNLNNMDITNKNKAETSLREFVRQVNNIDATVRQQTKVTPEQITRQTTTPDVKQKVRARVALDTPSINKLIQKQALTTPPISTTGRRVRTGYPVPALPLKLKFDSKDKKQYTNRKNFERDIRNTLGSLKSMFG